ncbi:DUF6020 family protein [Micromonospora sp. NPDC049679]|uniref:DUF6020 family protein n=1 Tax=Micromonospora sp. NPDC049679 TaxID=3155920 RepID=UPI0033BFBD67
MNHDAEDGPAETTAKRSRRLPLLTLITYGLAQAGLLFWWVAYHPGLFSPDSLSYIWQSTTGNWNTHHPISYTALVWLSLQLTGGLAALTLAQTVAMAAGLAYAVTGLRRLGGPAWLWSAAAVTVVALPPVGTFVMAVWKDVPFVICHVFLLGTLARLVARRRDGEESPFPRPLLLALAVELTLICLFRQNGFVIVAIMVVLCALLLRGAAARMIVAGVVAASVALLTNWLLLPALGVRDSDSIVALEAFFSDISVAYAADPAAFPPADTAVMATVAPLSLWRESANCHSVDTTVYDPAFDRRAAAAHKGELLAVWWDAARRSPGTIIDARICRGSIAWRPTSTGGVSRNPTPWGMRVYVARDTAFQQSPFRDAVYAGPLSDRARRLADQLTGHTNEPEWLLWRGANWAYLTYLIVGVVAWRRREPALLALATVAVAGQLSVLVFNNVQAARYMAAPFVLGVLLLPLLAVARRPADPVGSATPSEPAAAEEPAVAVGSDPGQARLEERG